MQLYILANLIEIPASHSVRLFALVHVYAYTKINLATPTILFDNLLYLNQP